MTGEDNSVHRPEDYRAEISRLGSIGRERMFAKSARKIRLTSCDQHFIHSDSAYLLFAMIVPRNVIEAYRANYQRSRAIVLMKIAKESLDAIPRIVMRSWTTAVRAWIPQMQQAAKEALWSGFESSVQPDAQLCMRRQG